MSVNSSPLKSKNGGLVPAAISFNCFGFLKVGSNSKELLDTFKHSLTAALKKRRGLCKLLKQQSFSDAWKIQYFKPEKFLHIYLRRSLKIEKP